MRASPYTAAFWTCADCSDTLKGVRNAVSIFLSTGYCIGSVIAIILNLILPEDPDDIPGGFFERPQLLMKDGMPTHIFTPGGRVKGPGGTRCYLFEIAEM